MSRARVKTIRLEHKHGALFDYSVKGKEVNHIRFSQAERSIVYVTVVFADRTEWSISIEPFSLPTARVSHFVSKLSLRQKILRKPAATFPWQMTVRFLSCSFRDGWKTMSLWRDADE